MKSKVLVLGLLALSFNAFSGEFSLKTKVNGNSTFIDIERSESCQSNINVQLINHDRFKVIGHLIVNDIGVEEPILQTDIDLIKLGKNQTPLSVALNNSYMVTSLFREPMLVEAPSYKGLSVKVVGCGHEEEIKVEVGDIFIVDKK